VLVLLECDQIRKTLERRPADQRSCCACSRPCRIRIGSCANSIERRRNLGDELIAQTRPSLVVPQRGTAKLSTRFRMQFDPHAAARVPSGSRSARSSSRLSGRDLRRPPVNAVPARSPMQQRLRRLAPLGWTAILRRLEHVRHEKGAAPRQAACLSTSPQCTTGGPLIRSFTPPLV
jgi:hypothetical protein